MKNFSFVLAVIATTLLGLGAAERVFAATVTGAYPLTIEVLEMPPPPNNCTITIPAGLNFGFYNAAQHNDIQSELTIQCASMGDYTVTMRVGSGGGSFTTRRMEFTGTGASNLDGARFNIYTNEQRTIVWADGRPGTGQAEGTAPAGEDVTIPIYGRVDSGQDLQVGAYESDITTSINF